MSTKAWCPASVNKQEAANRFLETITPTAKYILEPGRYWEPFLVTKHFPSPTGCKEEGRHFDNRQHLFHRQCEVRREPLTNNGRQTRRLTLVTLKGKVLSCLMQSIVGGRCNIAVVHFAGLLISSCPLGVWPPAITWPCVYCCRQGVSVQACRVRVFDGRSAGCVRGLQSAKQSANCSIICHPIWSFLPPPFSVHIIEI